MARDKEVSQLIAIKTNVTKWTNAIEKFTGGTDVYEVLEVSKEDWDALQPSEKWSLIDKYKSEHTDIKLERNKKSITDSDYKQLLKNIVEAESTDEKNKLLEIAKLINDYDNAKNQVVSLQNSFDKLKVKLTEAKNRMKQLEEQIEELDLG